MSIRALSWVFEHSEVAHRGDLLVLLVLADHAHDDGTGAYPSVMTIARKARLSERGAQYALRRLEKVGAIVSVGVNLQTKTVEYRLLLGGALTAPVQSEAQGGAVSNTEGCTPLHPNRHEPSVNRHTPPTPPRGERKTRASRRMRPGFSYDDAVSA